MNDDQIVEVLTSEEAAKLKASFEPPSGEDPAKLGRKVWQLALAGNNRDQIATKLRISPEVLDETLNTYRLKLGISLDLCRMLDNARIDQIICYWLPIAVGGPVNIRRIKAGEVFTEADFERPFRATDKVLQAMQTRVKILAATRGIAERTESAGIPGAEGSKTAYSERNIVIWLRDVMPSIEKITREVETENGSIEGDLTNSRD